MAIKTINVYHRNSPTPLKADVDFTVKQSLYYVDFILDGRKASGEGATLYDAFLQIRNAVEPHGFLLGINASRKNAGRLVTGQMRNEENVTIIEGSTLKTVSALGEASLDDVADIHHQKQNFDSLLESYEKMQENNKYLKERVKEVKQGDENRFLPILSTVVSLFSIVYAPLVFYVMGPLAWNTLGFGEVKPNQDINITNILIFLSSVVVLGIILYALAICVALENMFLLRRTTFGLFASIALPPISIIIVIFIQLNSLILQLQELFATTLQGTPLSPTV